MGVVYKVTNLINGREYIGKTERDFEVRKKEHLNTILTEKNSLSVFHRALKKYGAESFEWCILKECKTDLELSNIEKLMIISNKTHISQGGYNITFGGEGVLGLKHTEESKEKNRQKHLGENNVRYGKVGFWKGKKMSSETIEKMKKSANTPENISRNSLPKSEETKLKMRKPKINTEKMGRKRIPIPPSTKCLCGCGLYAKPKRKFIKGHKSKESKEKYRISGLLYWKDKSLEERKNRTKNAITKRRIKSGLEQKD